MSITIVQYSESDVIWLFLVGCVVYSISNYKLLITSFVHACKLVRLVAVLFEPYICCHVNSLMLLCNVNIIDWKLSECIHTH